jgi:YfiH family protein
MPTAAGEAWQNGLKASTLGFMQDPLQSLIFPDWPAPKQVRAVTTTRLGGVSTGPFASFNLGDHVGDDRGCVAANRKRLTQLLKLPAAPLWLNQTHGREVVNADREMSSVIADAAYARRSARVCAVLTADCLPVLLCDRAGRCVAAVHAGWRGLAAGVLGSTLASLACDPAQMLAWLGPAIGPQAFEVGEDVKAAFLALDQAYAECFKPSPRGRWLANLYGLAHRHLRTQGVQAIYGGNWCTVTDAEHFFSFRRDGRTGRMASLIWLGAD